MTDFSSLLWQEFVLQTLTLHWLTALVVVFLVAIMVTSLRGLNATSRHNIWLLTLASFVLMPLLIFAPRPNIELPGLSLSVTHEVSGVIASVPADTSRTGVVLVPASAALPDMSVSDSTPATAITNVKSAGSAGISVALVIQSIFVFWLMGVMFLLRRLLGEYRGARELELQSDSVTPYLERRFDQLCARLGIDERPLLRFHAGINAPMTVGLVRIWVAIPMTWRETIDDSVFDQTLTHELGHIARKDPLIHTVQRLLGILFWMYPAVWYVSRQLEIERESACDDWVLTHDGKSNTYATNLLDVAESLYLQPQVMAVGCLRSHSQLSRRIQNLLNKSSDHKVHSSWKLLALTSIGLIVTLSVSAVAWPDARQLTPPVAATVPVAPLPARPVTAVQNPAPAEVSARATLQSLPPIQPDSRAAAPVAPQPVTSSMAQVAPSPVAPLPAGPVTAVENPTPAEVSAPATLQSLPPVQPDSRTTAPVAPQPETSPMAPVTPASESKPRSSVDRRAQKTVSVMQDYNGKLTIEKHLNGTDEEINIFSTDIIKQPATYVTASRTSDREENGRKDSNKNRDQRASERENRIEDTGKTPAGFSITRWPVESNRISLAFDKSSRTSGDSSKLHGGLDFPMKEGSAVYSVAAGYVAKSAYSDSYGNYIVIDHGNGYKTKYANNQLNMVEQGDFVDANQEIAAVGNTSKDSTGPHVHFEVRLGESRIDPKSVFAPGH